LRQLRLIVASASITIAGYVGLTLLTEKGDLAMMRHAVATIRLVLVLGVFAMVSGRCFADLSDFEARDYYDDKGNHLPLRLFIPLNYDPAQTYPLILLLHGSGESGTDNEKPASHSSATIIVEHAKLDQYACFVLVPQTTSQWQWANFGSDEPGIALRMTLEVIGGLLDEFSIDPNALIVTGLSMGGFGTWDIIAKRPGLFAAAIPVCGGGDPTKADRMVGLPLWAFHSADDPVVPVEQTRRMIRAIQDAGGDPLYTEYPNGGHNAWDRAYGTPELWDWLFGYN
jgi:predicted peptidase